MSNLPNESDPKEPIMFLFDSDKIRVDLFKRNLNGTWVSPFQPHAARLYDLEEGIWKIQTSQIHGNNVYVDIFITSASNSSKYNCQHHAVFMLDMIQRHLL